MGDPERIVKLNNEPSIKLPPVVRAVSSAQFDSSLQMFGTLKIPGFPTTVGRGAVGQETHGQRSEREVGKREPGLLEQFYRVGPLVGQKVQRLEFQPSGENRCSASNCDCNSPVATIYVNGITFGEKGFISTATAVADRYGTNVIAIVNDQERSIVGDVANSAAGLVSSRLGRWAEKDAVENVIREVKAAALAGKEVRLVAYSQGAIVTSNALTELRNELGAEKFAKLGIVVDAYGAATHDWPVGIKVTEYRLEGDKVSKGTSWLGTAKEKLRAAGEKVSSWGQGISDWWNGRESASPPPREWQTARVVTLACPPDCDDPHDLRSYLACQSQFLIEKHRSDSGLDAKAVATELLSSIGSGRCSDAVHDQVVASCCSESSFAKSLLSAARSGILGRYQIPPELHRRLLLAAGG